MEYGWLIAFLLLVFVELASMGLTTIWFALGALAAYLAQLLNAPVAIQMALFVIVSIVTMIFVRPFAAKFINKNPAKTNVEAIAGKRAKVLVTINNIEGVGTVSIDGLEWTARTEDNTVIEQDEIVEVVRIEGVKAIVKKIK